jgi:diguanylate cyclase (GGDEF)-like protein
MEKFIILEKVTPAWWLFLSCFLILVIGTADYLTGSEIAFALFYLFPIILVAWFSGRRLGVVIGVIAAITWFIADYLTNEYYSQPIIGYWNAIVRFVIFVLIAFLVPALKDLEHEKMIARIDDLTGIANRRHFFQIAEAELYRSQRYKHPFTLIYIDLDGFKLVNDNLGHQVGDNLLCAFVNRTLKMLRKSDFMARLGGDEFVILLAETDLMSAQTIVPCIQSEMLDEMKRRGWPITFSMGVLTYQNGLTTIDELLRLADDLMYSVKKKSKNAIVYSSFPK